MSAIIHCVVLASTDYDPAATPKPTHSPAPFWWLLIHLNYLILVPSAKESRDGISINKTIAQCIVNIRQEAIQTVFDEAMSVCSCRVPTNRPERQDN